MRDVRHHHQARANDVSESRGRVADGSICQHCAPLIAMFVYAGFTAVAEKLDEIIERLTPPRQPRAHSRRNWSLAARILHPHAPTMFVVTEAEVTAIRTAFEQRGELSVVVELRRLFRGIDSISVARECVRIIADWQPPPIRPSAVPRLAEYRHRSTIPIREPQQE